MRLKSANFNNFNYYTHIVIAMGIVLGIALDASKSHAAREVSIDESVKFTFPKIEQNLNSKFDTFAVEKIIASKLPVLSETVNLVKNFEGFRASAYIDTSGFPVIGYGQTRVNGRTVRLGQYIT